MDTDFIRFSTNSVYFLPIFNDTEFFEEPVPCTVWGRWSEKTGTLWVECVTCEGTAFQNSQLSEADYHRFEDALVAEICLKYF